MADPNRFGNYDYGNLDRTRKLLSNVMDNSIRTQMAKAQLERERAVKERHSGYFDEYNKLRTSETDPVKRANGTVGLITNILKEGDHDVAKTILGVHEIDERSRATPKPIKIVGLASPGTTIGGIDISGKQAIGMYNPADQSTEWVAPIPERPTAQTESDIYVDSKGNFVPAGTRGAKPYETKTGKTTAKWTGKFENGQLVPASMTSKTATTEGNAANDASNQVDAFPDLSGKHLLDKLKTVPKTGVGDYALISAINDGRLPFDKWGSARSPIERERVQKLLYRVNPFFDAYWTAGIGALKKDVVAGKLGSQLQGMNQLLGHLEEYKTAYQNLNNKAISVGNTITNFVKENTGDPDVTAFRTASKAVISEGAGVFKTGQGAASPTTEEIKDWDGIVGLASSPEQYGAFGVTMAKLLKSRISAVNNRLNVIPNKPTGFSLLSPKAAESLNGWGVNIEDLIGTQPNPTGGATQPTQSKNWWE